MEKFISENIIFIIGSLILPAITWFFTRRHNQARELQSKDKELENKDMDINRQNIALYQDLLDDLEKRYEIKLSRLYEEIKNLEDKNHALNEEVKRLKDLIIKNQNNG